MASSRKPAGGKLKKYASNIGGFSAGMLAATVAVFVGEEVLNNTNLLQNVQTTFDNTTLGQDIQTGNYSNLMTSSNAHKLTSAAQKVGQTVQTLQPKIQANGTPDLRSINTDHSSASCDFCKGLITSAFGRAKCLRCRDADACSGCLTKFSKAHPGHDYLYIPAGTGLLKHVKLSDDMSAICFHCHVGIPMQEYWACLGCRLLACSSDRCSSQLDQHCSRIGHQRIITQRQDLVCEGCNRLIGGNAWYRCSQCPDSGFCLVCIGPRHFDHVNRVHHGRDYFYYTLMYSSYNAISSDPKYPAEGHGYEGFWGRFLFQSGPSYEYMRLLDALYRQLSALLSAGPNSLPWLSALQLWGDSIDESDLWEITEAQWLTVFKVCKQNYQLQPQIVLTFDQFVDHQLRLACVDPEETCRWLAKAILAFHLVDPMSNQPFPPLPRSVLPSYPDPAYASLWYDDVFGALRKAAQQEQQSSGQSQNVQQMLDNLAQQRNQMIAARISCNNLITMGFGA